jgi:hypothetical protein
MSSAPIDFVGQVAEPATQGLGRLVSQYTRSPKLIGLLTGLYQLGQDLDLLINRMSRILNPHDDVNANAPTYTGTPVDAGTAGTDDTGPDGTVCVQLDIIGRVVGLSRVLPNRNLMTNGDYLRAILVRIDRNHVKGATEKELIDELIELFGIEDVVGQPQWDIWVDAIGYMTVIIAVGWPITPDQESMFAISSGVNFVPGGLIARQSGATLAKYHYGIGAFCMSDANNDPGTPIVSTGTGFNTSVDGTDGYWAKAF